jgi:hypothetical protein
MTSYYDFSTGYHVSTEDHKDHKTITVGDGKDLAHLILFKEREEENKKILQAFKNVVESLEELCK